MHCRLLVTRASVGAGALALLAAAGAVHAQYKVIDADGKVTYTDRPSADAAATAKPLRAAATAIDSPVAPGAALPFELRQVAERYPVVLYTRGDCTACDNAREALRQRGIPFSEKTVGTDADVREFQRIEASNELPVLRIGSQQLRGYTNIEWSSYLDAAGYPKTSRLPNGYRGAAPTPLAGDAVAREIPSASRAEAAVPAARAAPAAPTAPAALPPSLQTAPNGIRF